MASRILIIEDEALLARNIARYLQRAGHEAVTAGSIADGEGRYQEAVPDVLIVDHNLPDGTGTDLIRRIRRHDLSTKIIMMTAHGNVAVAVEAMRAGADDYLTKPVSLDEIGLLIDRLVSRSAAEETLAYLRRREESRSGLDQIIGASPAIVAMKQRVGQVLAMEARQREGTPPPVLITGETGTGKELVARALHFDGKRRSQPFVEINCAALPGHLIESELFGHEKGAFTDARERRVGLIQSADHGTLFLDEIGDMSLVAQAKLLKVLEDGKIRPLGSSRERAVDVRIVAATNAAIEARTRDGTFRADLYYRLCGVSIATPRLREREGDVLLLARHFLQMHCKRYGRPGMTLGPAAEAPLLRHSWPGNVRELSNVIEQAAMLAAADEIGDADLVLREPRPASEPSPAAADGASTLHSIEREQIAQALARSSGNVTVAADALGVSRDTLRYRMERHGIRRSSFAP